MMPPSTSGAPAPTRCVVVGAGVIGTLTAYRLAQAGASVTLVDGGPLGAGTSGASFAHVNSSYDGYWDYVSLRTAGIQGYRSLRKEIGAPWWHRTGYLAVHRAGAVPERYEAHLARLRGLGHRVEHLEDCTAHEPALDVQDTERITRFPEEGYVELPEMVTDLASRAQELGAVVRTEDPVVGFMTSSQDVVGVRLRSGDRIRCDVVIACCGRWTDDLLSLLGLRTRFVAARAVGGTLVPGLLVITEPVDSGIRGVVAIDDINLRPSPGGRLMVWSGKIDAQLPEQGADEPGRGDLEALARSLLDAAAEHIPALAGARVERAIRAVRALPRDGLPVVGRLPRHPRVYIALSHAAATTAPAIAGAVVTEVVHDTVDERLAPFRPERLLAPTQGTRT